MAPEQHPHATICTSLYELIEAIRAVVEPEGEALVIPTILHVLRTWPITWLGDLRVFEGGDQMCPEDVL